MTSFVRRIAEPLGFPEEAITELELCAQKIFAAEGAYDRLLYAQELLFLKEGKDFMYELEPLYGSVDASPYSIDMVFLLFCAQPLKYVYKARNMSDELYTETMKDLLYKLIECRDVKGVFGTFVIEWYKKFYTCERVKLGRLQFETRAYPLSEPFRDIYKEGDTVIGCHIPSSGPLRYEDVIDSLKRAYEYYGDRLKNGRLYVYCHSWLMYPPYAGTVFKEGSNLYRFLNLFELIRVEKDPSYTDFFRVFNRDFDPTELDSLPEDTTLRRNLKKFLQEGNQMGDAYGFIEFDGERILTEKKEI